MMNRSVSNMKCLAFCLLSFAFGATAAFVDNENKDYKSQDKVAAYYRSVAAVNDGLAQEAYEKRNTEIALWTDDARPAIADNAALLYYQACLFMPEPMKAMRSELRPDATPTKEVRTYLGHCMPAIEMVEMASRIPRCSWAAWPEAGPTWEPLILKLGLIGDILVLDAKTLAFEGHRHVALDRCLTIRRIARHLSDDPELYRFERPFDIRALYAIRVLLGMMPPDADILTWFRDQLAVAPGPELPFGRILRALVKVQLDAMKSHPAHLLGIKETAIELAEGERAREDMRKLTDEQFRSRARDGLSQFVDSILRITESGVPYEQKLSQVREFCDEMMEDSATDPIVRAFVSGSGMNMKVTTDRSYSFYIQHEARVKATKAAVEIYLALATNGELPAKLPSDLPKDPSTGQDFGYEITDKGFVLRCQSKEFLRQGIQLSLEFNVRR